MINPGKWEKRWHPLREEWVVYSAHRNNRPWHGADLVKEKDSPVYDPSCYLCPGNHRVSGKINPAYTDVFVFENDHPVVGLQAPDVEAPPFPHEIYQTEKASGIAKVICYDPRHNISLSQMDPTGVVKVFATFQFETIELSKNPIIKSVLIFENKGEVVGVSNPHPHCQLYATDFPLKFVEQQTTIATRYIEKTGINIFEAIIQNELSDGRRIIAEDKHTVAFIPYFARYAFEIMIFPKNKHQSLVSLSRLEIESLAHIFQVVTRKLDINYNTSFPYVMSVMQALENGPHHPNFRMHLWIQPPYRQPGLIKYLAGPEIGAGNFMADTMPEDKAAELRRINLNNP